MRSAIFWLAIGACSGARPADPTYAAAVSREGRCREGSPTPTPLVVDWRPDMRADLDVAASRGLVAVRYGCDGLELVDECVVPGRYEFVGVSPKEQVLELRNSAEIRANLPTFGGALPVGGSAGGERTSELTVRLAVVGKRLGQPLGEAPAGRCERATHVVEAMTVGAFVVATHTAAGGQAGVEAPGAALTAGAGSDQALWQSDGDPAACTQSPGRASMGSSAAPAGCDAILRLDLQPLQPPAELDAPVAEQAAPPRATCPDGLRWTGTQCVVPGQGVAYACQDDQVEECRAQCDAGNGPSCNSLGFSHMEGEVVPLDGQAALALFARACALDDAYGCENQGALLLGAAGIPADLPAAREALEKACGLDPARCGNLGAALGEGRLGPPDPVRAAELLSRACLGGDGDSCRGLGSAYARGEGVPHDERRASDLYQQGCRLGDLPSCTGLGARYLSATGVAPDDDRARSLFQRACDGGEDQGCGFLGLMIYDGRGGSPERDRGRQLMQQACNSGAADGCVLLAVAYRAEGNAQQADYYFQKACEGGITEHCR